MSENTKPYRTRPWEGISLPTLLVFAVMGAASHVPGFSASGIFFSVIGLAVAEMTVKHPALKITAYFLHAVIALLLIASAVTLLNPSLPAPTS